MIVIFYRTCVALRCGSFLDLPSKYAEEASPTRVRHFVEKISTVFHLDKLPKCERSMELITLKWSLYSTRITTTYNHRSYLVFNPDIDTFYAPLNEFGNGRSPQDHDFNQKIPRFVRTTHETMRMMSYNAWIWDKIMKKIGGGVKITKKIGELIKILFFGPKSKKSNGTVVLVCVTTVYSSIFEYRVCHMCYQ